jgi:hypothetical protein
VLSPAPCQRMPGTTHQHSVTWFCSYQVGFSGDVKQLTWSNLAYQPYFSVFFEYVFSISCDVGSAVYSLLRSPRPMSRMAIGATTSKGLPTTWKCADSSAQSPPLALSPRASPPSFLTNPCPCVPGTPDGCRRAPSGFPTSILLFVTLLKRFSVESCGPMTAA